jgi:protein O-GlcNAc transferase
VFLVSTYFRWPDQWQLEPLGDLLTDAGRNLRLQRFQAAEACLLAVQQRGGAPNADALGLLLLLRLRQLRLNDVLLLLEALQATAYERPMLHFFWAQYWLQTGAISQIIAQSPSFWDGSERFWPLLLARAAFLIHLNKLPQAAGALAAIPSPWDTCLEALRLRCRILEREQRYEQALELLLQAVRRFPQHWPAQVHLVDLTIKARSQQHALPCLRQALAAHGPQPEILPSLVQIQMLRNRNADARRSALQEQLWNSVRPVASVAASNLHNCYDRLGYTEWLAFDPTQASGSGLSLSLEMRENRCMQAASQELPVAAEVVADVLESYRQQPPLAQLAAAWPQRALRAADPQRPLTVAWISADLAYHPVSRFLLGFFAAHRDGCHRHLLVDTCDHLGESNRCHFESLSSVEVVNAGTGDWSTKLDQIRALEADLAIDLSGWTGGHFMRGFLARLAPIQINYLGYFGSTGLPSMDVWLGDQQLFPEPMQEWHTEAIHRLQRCFIAWQPPELLPEAQVDPAEVSHSGGIRFGSFNHNRKLSDATLRLWGALLASIPGASLVLKASHRDDPGTQELLCRRMRRQGLDPERVLWLPRAEGPLEHLQHYGLVDVALDCFPNGGCTTTCEALWMGTPVITLTGRGYVSRMSTAVLHGAGMADWCAPSTEAYLELARAQADQLGWLRQNRPHWRQQLQTNPLGDAADLMAQLELAFSSMVVER